MPRSEAGFDGGPGFLVRSGAPRLVLATGNGAAGAAVVGVAAGGDSGSADAVAPVDAPTSPGPASGWSLLPASLLNTATATAANSTTNAATIPTTNLFRRCAGATEG
jgi:hypothetical protein